MDSSNVANNSALCYKLPVGEVAVPRLASTESRVSVAVPPVTRRRFEIDKEQCHRHAIASASAGGITLAGSLVPIMMMCSHSLSSRIAYLTSC